jgi:hypothetical protein
MKIELHLVSKGFLIRPRESVGPGEFIDDGKWSHDGVFLVDLDTERFSRFIIRLKIDLQSFAFVKVHLCLGELEGRQHIQNLSNIRVCTLDELVHNIARDLHLLPAAASERLDTSRPKLTCTGLTEFGNGSRLAAVYGMSVQKSHR